jgi:hypothetical protein
MSDPGYNESESRLITRLVDDAVGEDDHPRADAWMREHPEVRSAVAAQRRVVAELQTSGPEVPGHLVAKVQERVTEAYGSAAPRARSTKGRRGSVWRPAILAPVIVCAAVVVAIVLGVGGGAGSGPSVAGAAQLAYAPSTGPAPAARDARFLDVSYGGVTFPNYQRTFGAVPTGRRLDRLGGRPALTVFYRLRDGTRLSYTVFSGRVVPRPGDAVTTVYEGVVLHTFMTRSKLAVVTLVRFGRTCVLAAQATRDAVLALAAEPIQSQAQAV